MRNLRALLLFAVLTGATIALSAAAAGPGVLAWDVPVARAIQQAPLPGADPAAEALTWLGQTVPAVLVLTFAALGLLLAGGRRAEAMIVAAAAFLRLASPLLKAIFGSPRPTPDLVRVIERAPGLGFPSGHALGAVLLFGSFAVIAPALLPSGPAVRAARALALALILLTGLARVRTGAHWPSDVVGGFLWGSLLLFGLAAAYHRHNRRRTAPARPPEAVPRRPAHRRT